MGFSKKKQKNWRKAEARVGAKAKEKAKKARLIEGRQQLRESKRKAAEATGRGAQDGKARSKPLDAEALSEIKSVDALFASMADEDGASDSDESSAGAFHDVGGDGEDDDPAFEGVADHGDEEDTGLGPGAGARHAEELKAIKEKDPEFYKFLVEQDRALLDFRAPDDDDDDDEAPGAGAAEAGAEPAADEEEEEASAHPGRVLTRERLERIQASAKDSFTACKAALNAYHTAVRSIEERTREAANEQAGAEEGAQGKRKNKKAAPKEKSATAQRRVRRNIMQIEDEAIFSEVIEWSLSSMLGLLRHHAGELQADGGSDKKRRKPPKGTPSTPEAAAAGPPNPTRYKRWPRVKVLALIFWEETCFLLNHLVAPHMIEYLLRHCSTPEAMSWLWPLRSVRQRFIKRCCTLWATSKAHDVRLLAFLFLRNAAAMVLVAPDSPKAEAQQLDALLRAALRSFAEVASWGYSWRSLSTFRFMENCMVELLRLQDSTAYRLGYVCLRQLALILRNACMAVSQGGAGASAGKGSGGGEKSKKKNLAMQQAQTLISWPFVRSICLWTRAVGALPCLRPLAYPLSMITLGAVKHKLTSLQHFPFVYHLLCSLNRLGSSLEVFVPISSHILKAFSVLLQVMDKAYKKGPKGGEKKALDSSVKAPELEVVLRLSDGQLSEPLALEAVASSLCFLATDHLGLLSQSPSFPELITPVMIHLRRHSKHCRSEPLRRQLRTLVERAEASAAAVRAKRDALAEVPDFKKFLLFEPDTAIGKARTEALKRKAAEEKSRVEAEMAGDEEGGAKSKGKGRGQGDEEAGENGKARKRKKGKGGDGEKVEEEAAAAKKAAKKKRSVAAEARAAGSLPDRDKVEEMDFSGDE